MVNVRNVTYTYNSGKENVLEDISFDISDGHCMGVLGNNGTGKSTLIKCIVRICHAQNASVLIDGENVFDMSSTERAQNIAYVPQRSKIADMTVFDTVMLGRKPYIKWDATSEDHDIVQNAIAEMGLNDYVLRYVSRLSGGEVQKVMLARALAQQPRFLLLDEPTSNLDPRNQHEVLQTIKRMAKKHSICVLIVIHDLNLAVRYCDEFLYLKDSKVYADGGIETVTPETISDVYGIDVEVMDHRDMKVVVPY